jgi:hypothetical protein
MCEGLSLDDVLALDAASIAEHGFVVIGVDGPDPGADGPVPWAYTVGLLDAVDHPEMVIAGISAQTGGSVLSMLAEAALEGERFEVGDTIDLGRGIARVGAVHDIQRELGTFNMWDNLQRNGTLRARELEVVQILLPSSFFCRDQTGVQPRLSDPGARVDTRRPRPNRAERRRRPSRRHLA